MCLSDGITFSMVNKHVRQVIFHENRYLFVRWVLQPLLRLVLPLNLQTNWVDKLDMMPVLPPYTCVESTISSKYIKQFEKLESVNMISKEACMILKNFNKIQYKNEMYSRYKLKPKVTLDKVLFEMRHLHDAKLIFSKAVYKLFDSSIYCTLQEAKKQLDEVYLIALGLIGDYTMKYPLGYDTNLIRTLLPPFVKKFIEHRKGKDPRVNQKSVMKFKQLQLNKKPLLPLNITRNVKQGILQPRLKENKELWKCVNLVKHYVKHKLHDPEKTASNYTVLFNFFATLNSAALLDVKKPTKAATIYVKGNLGTFQFQETDIKIPESVIYFNNSTQRVTISTKFGISARAFIDRDGVLHTTFNHSPTMMSKNLGFYTLLDMFNSLTSVDKAASRIGIVTGNCVFCGRKMNDLTSKKRGYGAYCGKRMGMKDSINVFIASENKKRKREI